MTWMDSWLALKILSKVEKHLNMIKTIAISSKKVFCNQKCIIKYVQ